MSNENNDHMKEILSKQWNNDLFSLTNEEIKFHIENLFYQYFLVDVVSMGIDMTINEDGCFVNFNISGEVYRDPANITKSNEEEFEEEE